MANEVLSRVKTRLVGREVVPSGDVLEELVITVSDRVLIRMGKPYLPSLPKAAQSIAVDATVKMVNLVGYEGVSSESTGEGGSISTSFIDGVLSEYQDEFEILKDMSFDKNGNPRKKGVRFV